MGKWIKSIVLAGKKKKKNPPLKRHKHNWVYYQRLTWHRSTPAQACFPDNFTDRNTPPSLRKLLSSFSHKHMQLCVMCPGHLLASGQGCELPVQSTHCLHTMRAQTERLRQLLYGRFNGPGLLCIVLKVTAQELMKVSHRFVDCKNGVQEDQCLQTKCLYQCG